MALCQARMTFRIGWTADLASRSMPCVVPKLIIDAERIPSKETVPDGAKPRVSTVLSEPEYI